MLVNSNAISADVPKLNGKWSLEHRECVFWLAQYFPGRPFQINTQFEGWSGNPLCLLKSVWKCPGLSSVDGFSLPLGADSHLHWPRQPEVRSCTEDKMHHFHPSHLFLCFEDHVPSPSGVLLYFLLPSRERLRKRLGPHLLPIRSLYLFFSFIKAAFTWRMKCTFRLTVGWREKSELLPFEAFLPIQSQCRVVVWGPERPKIKLLSAGSAAF